jgi:hypothetical protein
MGRRVIHDVHHFFIEPRATRWHFGVDDYRKRA